MQFSRVRLPSVWHPVLIPLIPILSTFQANLHEVAPRELIVPLALSVGLTAGLWVLLARVWGDNARAALVVSLSAGLFFNFGSLDDSLAWVTEGAAPAVSLLKSVVVLVAAAVLLGLVLWTVLRRPRLLRPLTNLLNAFSALAVIALLALTAARTVPDDAGDGVRAWQPQAGTRPGQGTEAEAGEVVETAPNPPRLPDIYYIVLDGYGRGDVLRDLYGYDNSDFLDGLRRRGFYVADRSTANYCQTVLSISSSLNCRYHTRLAGRNVQIFALVPAVRDNTVLKTLKRHGYRFVTYDTGFLSTNMPDADVYLSPFPPDRPLLPESDFRSLLMEKTPLSLYWKVRACLRPAEGDSADGYTQFRKRIVFEFDSLGKNPGGASPKFVFAHVVCPHPPFLFGEKGEDTSPRAKPYLFTDGTFYRDYYGGSADAYVRGYRAQTRYISRLALEAIDGILRNSAEPPVIILQGDHGPGSRWNCISADPKDSDVHERMSILNAYYLPGGPEKGAVPLRRGGPSPFPGGPGKDLYDDITPVNSFRIVLNRYFGARLERLPDRSYFSSVPTPFDFVDVTDQVRTRPTARRDVAD